MNNIEKQNSKKFRLYLAFYRMMKEMFQTIPLKTIGYIFSDVLHGLSIVLSIYFLQKFFDSISVVYNTKDISRALFPLLSFLIANIMVEICNGWSNFHTEYLSPQMISKMYKKFYKGVADLDVNDFENPDVLDTIDKAKQGIETGLLTTLLMMSIFTFYIPYYIFMGIYLNELSQFLLLILLLVFIPVIIGKVIRFKMYSKIEDESAPIRRRMEYYEQVLCDRKYFKETRLLGAYKYFFKLFHESCDVLNRKIFQVEKKYTMVDGTLKIFTVVGYIGILIVLTQELLDGKISVGAFAAVFSGVGMMYDLAEEMFGGVMQYVARSTVALYNYQLFVNSVEHNKPNNNGELLNFDHRCGITLKNVFYKYPKSNDDAIKGVTLHIPANKTVAIVGENGAGKSTLVKLMIGIFVPTKGEVQIGGIKTQIHKTSLIHKACSAVFQNFQHYQTTLKENIIISEWQKIDVKDVLLKSVCVNAEVNSNEYPEKENTMLSREFGGTDVSGGQWQRIAIARGMYRTHNILVLDEPTSAIDPLEETKLYNKFLDISQGKTTIMVTHRIGVAKVADEIIVMKAGAVCEKGTHDELMKKKGVYFDMYSEQAKWYKN